MIFFVVSETTIGELKLDRIHLEKKMIVRTCDETVHIFGLGCRVKCMWSEWRHEMDVLSVIRAFIRMEVSADTLEEAVEYAEEGKKYIVPVEDWVVLYEKTIMKDMKLSKFYELFLNPFEILLGWNKIEIYDDCVLSSIEALKRNVFFTSDWRHFFFCTEGESGELPIAKAMDRFNIVEQLKDDYECIKLNQGKPFGEWVFPDFTMQRYINDAEDCSDEKSDDEIGMYRRFVDTLCERGYENAWRHKAYGHYDGNRAYTQDWEIARDSMEQLLEVALEEQEIFDANINMIPEYAYKLGSIYYYGHCNGIHEYEKAFRAFSVGAANGGLDSMLRLAEMYRHGRGTLKSPKATFKIIKDGYDKSRKRFICELPSYMAEFAYNMGRYLYKDRQSYAALYYFIVADFASKHYLRDDYPISDELKDSIQTALTETRSKVGCEANCKSISDNKIVALQYALSGDYVVKFAFNEIGDSIEITASREVKPSKWWARELIEIPFSKQCYYNLQDEVIEVVSGNVEYNIASGKSEFHANAISLDKETNLFSFLIGEEVVATLKADKYTFDFEENRKC